MTTGYSFSGFVGELHPSSRSQSTADLSCPRPSRTGTARKLLLKRASSFRHRTNRPDAADLSLEPRIEEDVDDIQCVGRERVSLHSDRQRSRSGTFVRNVAKRCSLRVRTTSQSYRRQVNKQLHRIPTHLLKSVFIPETKVQAEPIAPLPSGKAFKLPSKRTGIVRIPEDSMLGRQERPVRPSPPNVPDGGALGKLVVFPEDGGCLPGGPDTSAKREKWQMVVNEIVETERSYVEALSGVITGYMNAIGAYAAALKMTTGDSDVLFGNIKDLHSLNSSLLSDLESCGGDPVEICACFVKRKESFNLYTEYCTNFPLSVKKLDSLLQTPGSAAAEFFKGCQLRVKHTLPLGSQLIKPVQRILKYHLLMRELVKNTVEHGPGVETIQEACDTMHGVANHINEMKRENEKVLYMQELQSRLVNWQGDELSSYGALLKEGLLRQPKKLFRASERKVYLFEKLLLLAKERDGDDIQVKAFFKVDDLGVSTDDGLVFRVSQLSNISTSCTLQAQDEHEKQQWTSTLRRTIVASDSRLSDKTKEQLYAAISKDEGRNFSESRLRPTSTSSASAVYAGNSDTPRSRSPRWRRATVIVNTGEESAAVEADVDVADGAASTPPERPPRPHRMMSSPQIMATLTRSPEAISPSIGLKERFSRLFSREATSGEDSTDGSRSASPEHAAIAISKTAAHGDGRATKDIKPVSPAHSRLLFFGILLVTAIVFCIVMTYEYISDLVAMDTPIFIGLLLLLTLVILILIFRKTKFKRNSLPQDIGVSPSRTESKKVK